MTTLQIVSAVLAVAGLAMSIGAYRMFVLKRRKIAGSYQTVGEVIDVKEHSGGEDGPTRHPVVKFKAESGEDVVFESTFGAANWRVTRGDKLTVLVSRSNVHDAEVLRFAAQWGKPLVLFIIAMSLIESALVFFVFAKNK
jgi:uncharacterized integral membrane protein